MDFHRYVRDRVPSLPIPRGQEVLDELAEHLSDLYDEARASGLDHEAALALAADALPEQADRLSREIESASRAWPRRMTDRLSASLNEPPAGARGRWPMVSDLRLDLRYALRSLLHAPGFTAVVALTMALGIGANAIIFSAVDAVLLRSLPVVDPERIVGVYTMRDERSRFSSSSYSDYADVLDSGVLEDVAAVAPIALAYEASGETRPLSGEVVSGNYFRTLGVPMAAGRDFLPEEDRPGSPVRVAVLSHAFWQRQFGADPSIVGQTLTLNGNAYAVVGVAPSGFQSVMLGRSAEVWVPMAVQPEVRPPSAGVRRAMGSSNLLTRRAGSWLNIVGRLRPGTSIAETMSGLDVLARQLEAAYPESNQNRRFNVAALGDGPGLRRSSRELLWALTAAVGMMLLIACANVASLLLARSVSRQREVAVRIALGAGQSRLVRQWLTESVLLSLLGASGGLLIAWWGIPLLHQLGLPPALHLGLDLRVLGFTLAVAVCSGLLFGLAPVLQTLRRDTVRALREEGGAVATGRRAARLRGGFVVAQVALSLMLLVGGGLFLQTLRNAYAVDLGYDPATTLLADINLDVRGYSQEAGTGVYERILERLNAIPGVRAAGAARVTVLSGGARSTAVSLDGRPLERGGANALGVRTNIVSHRYLDALGIPIVRGRAFASSDTADSTRVAIVSRSLAARLWPDADPVGKPLVSENAPFEVIGVVPDTVYSSALEREPPPFFYALLAQNYESGVTLHVGTAVAHPTTLIAAVRQSVRDVDPRIVVDRPRTLADDFETSIGSQRMMAALVGLFAGVALLLAAVGLYGVMAHLAGERTAEVGIRLALGARPSSILALMTFAGLRLVAIGTAIGLAGAFLTVRFIEHQLFGLTPTDPATFFGVSVLLAVVGVIACVIPARRAMRVDPVVALRNA